MRAWRSRDDEAAGVLSALERLLRFWRSRTSAGAWSWARFACPSSLRYESVHDQMASGRRFRVLNVVDDVTRECLAAVPDTSISGRRVVRELTALIERRGKPGMIVSDNVLGREAAVGKGQQVSLRRS